MLHVTEVLPRTSPLHKQSVSAPVRATLVWMPVAHGTHWDVGRAGGVGELALRSQEAPSREHLSSCGTVAHVLSSLGVSIGVLCPRVSILGFFLHALRPSSQTFFTRSIRRCCKSIFWTVFSVL